MIDTPYTAPDFSLPDETGKIHQLSDFRNEWLVLYFYPKDETPGCTTEACSLRDARDTLAEMGASIVGISMDPSTSHEKFKARHTLNFTLLSDPDKKALQAYGAWGKKQFGREGVLRKTFIIDPNGMVQKVYGRVMPIGHGERVIADLKRLQEK